eukprot:6213797-Pleurochrysis_carterae.AAC.5
MYKHRFGTSKYKGLHDDKHARAHANLHVMKAFCLRRIIPEAHPSALLALHGCCLHQPLHTRAHTCSIRQCFPSHEQSPPQHSNNAAELLLSTVSSAFRMPCGCCVCTGASERGARLSGSGEEGVRPSRAAQEPPGR